MLRRFHFDRTQEPVPPMAGFLKGSFDVDGIAKSIHEGTRLFFVVRLPEEKSHLGGLSRIDLDHDLQGGTRIQTGASVPSQSFMLHRGRIVQRAVTSDERGAITSDLGGCRSGSGKDDAFSELRLVGVAGKQTLA